MEGGHTNGRGFGNATDDELVETAADCRMRSMLG